MKFLNHSKECLLIVLFIIQTHFLINASQAYPYPVVFTQSDGSEISVLIKGDEFLNWKETEDGFTLLHNKRGDLEYGVLNDSSVLMPSGIMARNPGGRSLSETKYLLKVPRKLPFSFSQIDSANVRLQKRNESLPNILRVPMTDESGGKSRMLRSAMAVPTLGNRKLICILMNFTDVTFQIPPSNFNDLFNQVGYTTDGATGSVKDFFLENSYNQYDLTVDVAGPFNADHDMAYYGNNVNGNANALIVEAIQKADPTINFADYDNDGNGEVDGIYVLFAGRGEESGGSADAIWSHAGGLNLTIDGVTAKRYSCSPELRRSETVSITRIGVICHEFSHVLGAPDFYDTDYEVGGSYPGTGAWDIMAGGTWNNAGATPAHHNPWTKVYKYGWASATLLNSPRTVTLKNMEEFNDSYGKIKTLTEGEFFMVENRTKQKFDAYVPGSGLILYHVHKNVSDGSGGINATHPLRMYPVAQNATENPFVAGNYGTINAATCPWDGTGKTEFTDTSTPSALSWSGEKTNKPIRNIVQNALNETVSFDFMDPYHSPPTMQASAFNSNNIMDDAVTIQWTRGNGDRVVVLARRREPVETAPSDGVTYLANSSLMLGQLADAGTYVVYDGAGTSVTVTGLHSASLYHFAVFEYNAADHSYMSPGLTGSVTTVGCSPQLPYTSSSWIMYITGVTLNSLSNISGTSATSTGYSDYIDQSAELLKGTTYPISVKVYNGGGTNLVKVKAWIDWDKDCSFAQPNEVYDLGSTTSSSTLLNGLIRIPNEVSEGTYTMRIRSKYNSDPTPTGDNGYSEAEDYTIRIRVPIMTAWNGTTWSNAAPTYLHDVTLQGDYEQAGFSCNNLIVNPAKHLTIASGSMDVGKNLTLRSDATGTATLINNGVLTVRDTIRMEQFLPAGRNWYMSSPFTNALAPAGFTYYSYNEVLGLWESKSAGSEFLPSMGYIVQSIVPSTFVLTGSGSNFLNSGQVTTPTLTRTVSITKAGFNLIGNPYPSFLSVNSVINANASMVKSLWYRTKNAVNKYVFDVVNTSSGIGTNNSGLGNATGVVPPMQSFWVRLADGSDTANLRFEDAQRLHQSEPNLLKTPEEDLRPTLRFQISDNRTTDEAILYASKEATVGYDDWDSPKMSDDNDQTAEIYFLAEKEKVAISGLPNFIQNQPIPILFKSGTADSFSIKLTEKLNVDAHTSIFIKDSLLNKEFDLTESVPCNFASDSTTYDHRFFVLFRSTTPINREADYPDGFQIESNAGNQLLITRTNVKSVAHVRIVNAIGRMVANVTITGKQVRIDRPLTPGFYFMNVEEQGVTHTKKFLIK